jgi:hypothetical protein
VYRRSPTHALLSTLAVTTHLNTSVTDTLIQKAMSAFRFALRGAALSRTAFTPLRVQSRFALPSRATYASAAGLNKEEISKRVLQVLKGFERVDQTKVCIDT